MTAPADVKSAAYGKLKLRPDDKISVSSVIRERALRFRAETLLDFKGLCLTAEDAVVAFIAQLPRNNYSVIRQGTFVSFTATNEYLVRHSSMLVDHERGESHSLCYNEPYGYSHFESGSKKKVDSELRPIFKQLGIPPTCTVFFSYGIWKEALSLRWKALTHFQLPHFSEEGSVLYRIARLESEQLVTRTTTVKEITFRLKVNICPPDYSRKTRMLRDELVSLFGEKPGPFAPTRISLTKYQGLQSFLG